MANLTFEMNAHRARPRTALLCSAVAAAWFAIACGGSSDGSGSGGVVECQVTPVQAPTSCPPAALRYSDVQPIFQRRCLGCHSGLTDQWPLTDYPHVASWYDI